MKRFLFESKKWLLIHVGGHVIQFRDSVCALFRGPQRPDAKFILFGKGRSGTTLLLSLLN